MNQSFNFPCSMVGYHILLDLTNSLSFLLVSQKELATPTANYYLLISKYHLNVFGFIRNCCDSLHQGTTLTANCYEQLLQLSQLLTTATSASQGLIGPPRPCKAKTPPAPTNTYIKYTNPIYRLTRRLDNVSEFRPPHPIPW